jgi:hypothetical protein
MRPRRSARGHIVLASFGDRQRFAADYNGPDSGITTGPRPPTRRSWRGRALRRTQAPALSAGRGAAIAPASFGCEGSTKVLR